MDNVLVIGANGATGRKVCELLEQANNYTPFAMVRHESQRNYFNNNNIKTVLGDLEENFKPAFKHIDKVIFAAGSGGNTGDDKTEAVDKQGAKTAIDFAKEAQIDKFVMLSSMGTDNPSQMKSLQTYLEAKKEADDHLKHSKLKYSIVQPGSLTHHKAAHQVNVSERLGDFGEISREDVAFALVYCLNEKHAPQKSFEMISGNTPIEKAIDEL